MSYHTVIQISGTGASLGWLGGKLRSSWLLGAAGFVAFGVVPWLGSDYWLSAILVPFLVLSLAGLGLNVLTGYAGQLSLGSAAFMAIGAFATYNLAVRVPGLPLLLCIGLGGIITAMVSGMFGLPSLRIKGFYLIVSTLAAQFLVPWILTKFSWFSNDQASGVISAPRLAIFGVDFNHPVGRYWLTLGIVSALFWLGYNLVRSELGRHWMAVRDMDTAAHVIGIPLFKTQLLAFALSGFFLGVAGALWAFTYLGTVEPHGFDLNRSFQILFIIIIGGLGRLLGSVFGAAFMVLFPLGLSHVLVALPVGWISAGQVEHLQKILFGALIILFLIKEPEGLARLWQRFRERAERWPLRY